MKKITITVPVSWDDERIENVKRFYEEQGYYVFIMPIPG